MKPAPPLERVATRGSLAGEPESQAARVAAPKVSDEFFAAAYGEALMRVGQRRADLVVLDGDLSSDCRLREFETTFPERFIQNDIAEQDMVSMAGGLANRPFHKLAVDGYPACGTPPEALQFHGLDGVSIAERIRAA